MLEHVNHLVGICVRVVTEDMTAWRTGQPKAKSKGGRREGGKRQERKFYRKRTKKRGNFIEKEEKHPSPCTLGAYLWAKAIAQWGVPCWKSCSWRSW